MDIGRVDGVTPKEQIVVASVQLLNLDAQSAGVNGKLTPRALKTMLKFRNRSLGRPSFLQVVTQTAKGRDPLCPKFDVDKITQIRSSFMSQGMVTIHASNTAIMIKEAKPEELKELLEAIRLGQIIAARSPNSASVNSATSDTTDLDNSPKTAKQPKEPAPSFSGSGSKRRKSNGGTPTLSSPTENVVLNIVSSSNTEVRDRKRDKVQIKGDKNSSSGPLQQSRLNFQTLTPEEKLEKRRLLPKRPRSPSPTQFSTPERLAFKHALKTKGKDVVVKITSKLTYLQYGFSANPTHLTISKISMKRLDSRLLALSSLCHLDLSNNRLENVDALRQLPSTLDTLKLSQNSISFLDSRLRFAWGRLTLLDLSYNKLQMLPESLVYLTRLRSLDVSNNELVALPYNFQFMGSLRILLVNNNQLRFLPHAFSIGLCALTKLDLSHNPELRKSCGPRWIELDDPSVPSSLLEFSAKAVLASNNRTATAFANLTAGDIPNHLMEYLYRAKRCGRCRQLVTRYVLKETYSGVDRAMAQEIICNGPADNVKTAYCPHHYIP